MIEIIFTKKGIETYRKSVKSKFIDCKYALKEAWKEFTFNNFHEVFILHGNDIRIKCGE